MSTINLYRAYVDLNPNRAAIAEDLEGSEYTAIKDRIDNNHKWLSDIGIDDNDQPFHLSSHVDLVDKTDRCNAAIQEDLFLKKQSRLLMKLISIQMTGLVNQKISNP